MSNPKHPVILVGDRGDPHLDALAALIPAERLVVLDAARFEQALARITPAVTTLTSMAGTELELPDTAARGWLRRLAPAGWQHNVTLGSHQAAVMASRVALIATILREPSVSWVSPVDRLYAAENKIVQYRAASAMGIPIPQTMIAFDVDRLADGLGEPFILKPLGPGNYEADDQQQVVFTTATTAANLADADLMAAPFIAQSAIKAVRHLRVITIFDQAWAGELDATHLPLDWRTDIAGHHGFRAASWLPVQDLAVRLAHSLGVGMSSQDWIIGPDGPVFIDLNPGGQWLFLPEEIAKPATEALAAWLTGE